MDPGVRDERFNRTRGLDKLRPAGASQKADGLGSPMAPVVTTGVLIVKKKTFLTRHPCAGGFVNLFCIVPRKIHELCVSSMHRGHAKISLCVKKTPCNCVQVGEKIVILAQGPQ